MTEKPNTPRLVSNAPPPITPIRGSYYSRPTAPAPIDWGHWGLMRDGEVLLWHAVALSVNVNPDAVKMGKLGEPFDKAMRVALSHVNTKSLPLTVQYPNLESSPVILSRFAAWAVKLNIQNMPPELVAMATVAQPAPAKDTATPAPAEELDYSLLATPAELLDAFGRWGMDAAWFDDLNSHQWLFDARRKKGQGQRGHVIEPLFCPFAVMNGLIGKVRKAKRLQPDTAWRTLAHKFPKVYAANASFDPRDRTGD